MPELVRPAGAGLYAAIGELAPGEAANSVLWEWTGDDAAVSLRDYLAELLTRYYQLMPASYRELAASVYRVAQHKVNELSFSDEQLLPSHNDLVLENILIDDTGRIWIIDWEYSSMTSPYWDLATICNSFELDGAQSRELLDSYL